MSQRLAANKRPKGQTLQTSSGSTAHMQDSRKLGVPKRKPKNAKRSIEANANSAQEGCGNKGSSFVRNDCQYRLEIENEDLKQIMTKNVFFDSYYPKLQGDFSEDYDGSKKSQSSTVGIRSNIFSSEILKVGDSPKTDSNDVDTSKGNSFFNSAVEPVQSIKCRSKKGSDQHSNKSRLTFDSNTYTLHSNGSDRESAESRTSGKDNNDTAEQSNDSPSDEHQNTSDEKGEAWENEDEVKIHIKSAEESREALSAVDCFTHLYRRIETLEDLLQQTLANSVEQKKCKCLEKPKNREKQQPSKTKFSTSKISNSKKQLAVSGSPRACGDPSKAEAIEEKENLDTDNELRSIKKRLRALERKLKQAKTSISAHSLKKNKEPSLRKKRLETSQERLNDKCCCRMYNLVNAKESDYTRPLSETDYFLPSEMLVLTRSELLSEKESSEWNLKNEVKRKIISNCKRIKKKCSSIISSRRNKNRPPKTANKCNEIFTEESTDTTCLCRSFSAHIKKDKKTSILYVKCPHAHAHAHFQKKPRKKRLKKIKRLCTKNSLKNFIPGQGEGNREWEPIKLQNESNGTSASLEGERNGASDVEKDKYVTSKKFKGNDWPKNAWANTPVPGSDDWPPRAYYMTFPYDFTPNPHSDDCKQWKNPRSKSESKRSKPLKKQSPFRNPIEILKRGGKIKIPVLFEEVCKTLKAQKPSHKASNVSMRFVLVERDPKHPLKKLIKKLSNGKTPTKVERYVFGVSKCCCDNEGKMKAAVENWKNEFSKGLLLINLAVLTVVFLIAYHYWRKRNFYKLAATIDGPKALPLIGNAMEYLALDHIKILDYLLDITTEYKGLAKVWLGGLLLIHISRPEDLEILLSSNKLIEKNKMYRFFDDVLGQGLLNARGNIWRKHRKIIAPTFHPSILKHFVKIFSEQSKILVKVLEKNADGRIFNVFPYVRNCALDFITETALENHIGAQLRVVAPATRAAERLMNITYNRMFKLWLYSDFIFYRTQQGKEYLRLRDLVKESTEPLLEVKKKEVAEQDQNQNGAENVKRKSFFRQLVELNENADNFNDKELRDEVVTMIITGYETTAATVGFILVMLGIHQNIQTKVYEEVMAMQEFLEGRELEAEDLIRFEYMDRVIKETLRLYPVGPIIFRECTSDVKLTTCTIPKGASVAVVILKTHRDPAIWENPNEFNPDHFLPEKCEKRHPYAYIPFSAGPRNCIGKQYAYLSMKVMLYHILSNYKIFCDLRTEDIKIKSEVTLKMVGGFKIRLLQRQKAND